jgi:hypothetical protein
MIGGCIPSLVRRENTWPLVIVITFALVYLSSMTFVYAEGDHAASVAYHVLGRDSGLQPPFAPYHGMMDVVLSILPAQEPILRIASLVVTSLAAVGMTTLILFLIFDWIRDVAPSQKWAIAAILMLASPELLYLGLVYSPTSVAMCFVILAHLLLRRTLRTRDLPGIRSPKGGLWVIVSLVLFGLGVACRWSVVVYGAVIATDLVISGTQHRNCTSRSVRERMAFAVLWGALALPSSLLAIAASGYGPHDIVGRWGDVDYYVQDTGTRLASGGWIAVEIGANLQSMVTPGFLTLGIVGFAALCRRRDLLVVVVLSGMAGIIPWLFTGVPKLMITAVPGMVVCVALGSLELGYEVGQVRLKLVAWPVVALLLLGPWIIGVRVSREGSAWGPGFEIRPYDRNESEGVHVALALGPGACFNTYEGPRPIFGHAFVLLGGAWRELVTELADARHQVVKQAISVNVPVLMAQWSPSYVVNELAAMGFTTSDPQDRALYANGYFTERRFLREEDQEVTLLYHEIKGEGTISDMQQVASLNADVVVFDGYPRVARHLYLLVPEALQKLGPTSAILDLNRLRSGLHTTTVVD